MPVYFCDPSALAEKVAEVEAAGETIVSIVVVTEQSMAVATKVDGRRKSSGLETR